MLIVSDMAGNRDENSDCKLAVAAHSNVTHGNGDNNYTTVCSLSEKLCMALKVRKPALTSVHKF